MITQSVCKYTNNTILNCESIGDLRALFLELFSDKILTLDENTQNSFAYGLTDAVYYESPMIRCIENNYNVKVITPFQIALG